MFGINIIHNNKELVKMNLNASLFDQMSIEKAELCKKVNYLESQLRMALSDKNKLSQIDYLAKDKADLVKKVNALDSQLRILEQDRDRLNRNEAAAINKAKEFQDDLKKKQEEVDDGKKRISFLETKVNDLETTLAIMRSSKDAIMNCKSFLDQAINLLKTATSVDVKPVYGVSSDTLKLFRS